jgi:hypothetical protein
MYIGVVFESALETLSISMTHVKRVFLKESALNQDKKFGD